MVLCHVKQKLYDVSLISILNLFGCKAENYQSAFNQSESAELKDQRTWKIAFCLKMHQINLRTLTFLFIPIN